MRAMGREGGGGNESHGGAQRDDGAGSLEGSTVGRGHGYLGGGEGMGV